MNSPGDPFHAMGTSLAAASTGKAVSEVLQDLILTLSGVLDGPAITILVATGTGELDLLAATSARTADLELAQAAAEEGPCVDCLRTGTTVRETGDAIVTRWPVLGSVIAAAGFRRVLAIPLRWRAQPVAVLTLYWPVAERPAPEEQRTAEIFAAAATLILGPTSRSQRLTSTDVSVLHQQTVIEQATGALAYQLGISIEAADQELRSRGHHNHEDLATVAHALLTSYATTPPQSD